MAPQKIDLAVIGAGSGNRTINRNRRDWNTVIAEPSRFGGTCMNRGCIPSKMLVRAQMLARAPEEAARLGVSLTFEGKDWPSIRDRVFSHTDHSSDGGRKALERQENVRWIPEEVQLTGPKRFITASGEEFETERLVIAAGSRPHLPNIAGIGLPGVHTSDTIMRIEMFPNRLVIVGGGNVASEFAAVFSGLGAEVTQLVRGTGGVLKKLDGSLREAFTARAHALWALNEDEDVTEVTSDASSAVNELTVHTNRGQYVCDAVLFATGRVPNTDRLRTDLAGIDLTVRKEIIVDEYQRVLSDGEVIPNVFALGDITNGAHLKHAANYEASLAKHNLEHPDSMRKHDGRPVPFAVFTHPELAQVGLTVQEAIAAFGAENIVTAKHAFYDSAYGWAMEDRHGFFQVVADARTGLVLGAHVLGEMASVLLQSAVLAMTHHITVGQMAHDMYWVHPALSEVALSAYAKAAKQVRR